MNIHNENLFTRDIDTSLHIYQNIKLIFFYALKEKQSEKKSCDFFNCNQHKLLEVKLSK